MKILSTPPYCEPEQLSSSHLTADLEAAYAAAGYELLKVVPMPSRGISDEVRNQYKKIRYEEKYGGKLIIRRFPLMKEPRFAPFRALRYMLCHIIQYLKCRNLKDVDVIIGASTPPTQGLLCAKLKKRLGVPFVYNLQDMFPETLVTAGMTREGSLIWKLGNEIAKKIYRSADSIIVISENFVESLISKGVPAEKIKLIYNWIDTDNVVPVAREDNILFERFGLPRDRFYICYSGNIGLSQNFEMLLDTAETLSADVGIQFVIIGEGAFGDRLRALVESRGLTNVHLFGFQPYEDIAHVFSLGDADLVISKSGTGSSSVPSKTWSIMSAARPVLASFDLSSELATVINRTNSGVCVQADDREALVSAILRMYENRALCTKMGLAGRNFVTENLSRGTAVGKYIEVIEKTVNGRGGSDK